MSDQLMKTFWKAVSVVEEDGGFSVRLDDKPLKTPAKAAFTVPSQGLAQAIADEWSALDDKIDPTRLPFTKLCNAAIDNMSEKADASISAFRSWLGEMDNFELMSCHDLVMLSGSIVIARAVVEAHISPEDGWNTSIIDDIWQAEKWGEDEEALALRAVKSRDFATAARMMTLLKE